MIYTLIHPSGLTQRLAVADLLDGGASTFRSLIPAAGAVVYSDPPWNPGNEKWWRRHAGAAPPESYDRMLDAWCRAISACNPPHVFCEQSANDRHCEMLLEAVRRCPRWILPLKEEWTVYYGSPGSRSCVRPNRLLHFGKERLRGDPTGLRGEAMTKHVFDALALPAGTTVADPCMGKGMTSRQCHLHGLHAIGTELNPARLAKAMDWLTRRGYQISPESGIAHD